LQMSGFGERFGFLTAIRHGARPWLVEDEAAEVFGREGCAKYFQRLEQVGLPHLGALVSGILWQTPQAADRPRSLFDGGLWRALSHRGEPKTEAEEFQAHLWTIPFS